MLMKEQQLETVFKETIAMYLNKYIDCKISYSPEDYDIDILTYRLLNAIKKIYPYLEERRFNIMESNEMKILKAFVYEFSPFHDGETKEGIKIVNTMNWEELWNVVDEIVDSHFDR